MVCQDLPLVQKVCEIYDKLSKLNSLKPSKDVNTLFTDLVLTCIPPAAIDVTKLCKNVQEIRSNLIKICGEAEGLLESHYSSILGSFDDNPLDHLSIFPYYNNYIKLSLLEFTILTQFGPLDEPKRVAFLGSGPLPLSSIVLATYHLTNTCFHNYDIDSSANHLASRLVSKDPDLSERMFFHTADVMDVTSALKEYEVVFLAALVGMDKTEKVRVIDHLAKYMAPGAILMLRSAHGARAFLYPVIDPCDLLGFEVLSVFHPTDDVINSVVIARKLPLPFHSTNADQQGKLEGTIVLPIKCSEIDSFIYPLNQIGLIEDLALEEQV
ncbi:hypothetical protein ACET3Z_030869 [Daucus carota]